MELSLLPLTQSRAMLKAGQQSRVLERYRKTERQRVLSVATSRTRLKEVTNGHAKHVGHSSSASKINDEVEKHSCEKSSVKWNISAVASVL